MSLRLESRNGSKQEENGYPDMFGPVMGGFLFTSWDEMASREQGCSASMQPLASA